MVFLALFIATPLQVVYWFKQFILAVKFSPRFEHCLWYMFTVTQSCDTGRHVYGEG